VRKGGGKDRIAPSTLKEGVKIRTEGGKRGVSLSPGGRKGKGTVDNWVFSSHRGKGNKGGNLRPQGKRKKKGRPYSMVPESRTEGMPPMLPYNNTRKKWHPVPSVVVFVETSGGGGRSESPLFPVNKRKGDRTALFRP